MTKNYESIKNWRLVGEITEEGGLNQLFRLKWKVQSSHIGACSKPGKLGQFHNILAGSKLCSCSVKGVDTRILQTNQDYQTGFNYVIG